jgi:hypothetical protein
LRQCADITNGLEKTMGNENRDDDKTMNRPGQQGDRRSTQEQPNKPQRPQQGGQRDEDQSE